MTIKHSKQKTGKNVDFKFTFKHITTFQFQKLKAALLKVFASHIRTTNCQRTWGAFLVLWNHFRPVGSWKLILIEIENR